MRTSNWRGARRKRVNGFWKDKTVVVTGGAGFLGSHVVDRLGELACAGVHVPRSVRYDLTDAAAIRSLLQDTEPDIVLHLAAMVGGIGANRDNPGLFFYKNAMMGVQMHDARAFRSLLPSEPYAPIQSSLRYRLKKTISGTAIPRRQTHPMAWQKR
jgi:hypothetical protein